MAKEDKKLSLQCLSDLITEIERRIEMTKMLRATEEIKNARIYAFTKILSFLNTLEVKEVDLETELRKFVVGPIDDCHIEIAKHFYELGLQTQKGEL